jgi:hypothetical protein
MVALSGAGNRTPIINPVAQSRYLFLLSAGLGILFFVAISRLILDTFKLSRQFKGQLFLSGGQAAEA